MNNKSLFAFNFKPEGFNQVWADTKVEAIAKAKLEFPSLANQIDENSFRELKTEQQQRVYWNNMPLMD